MTGHEHDMGGTVGIALVSAGIGLLNYMTQTEITQAVLVAALCGLAGGVMKGFGVKLYQWMHTKIQKRRKG
jgi:hypothetical protein